MTHDARLPTIEQIMSGHNPFETVSTPLGTMERWRAEAMLIGTTSGAQHVFDAIRADAAAQAARADEAEARATLIRHVSDKIADFEKRFDALEARLAEAEHKRRADEARKAKFDEEPLVLPPDISEYQASAPPSEIGDDTPPPGGELHAIAAKEEPSLEDADNMGDLPKELEDPPDPVPEPRGAVYPQPVAISLNKE
jgi:hypothetical protein